MPAYSRILLPWDSQPQEVEGVDWGNPLAMGLVAAVSGGGGGRTNAVTGAAPTLAGTGLVTPTSAGAGADLDTTAGSKLAWSLPSTVQTSATLLVVCMRRTTADLVPISLHSKTQAAANIQYLQISNGSNRPVAGSAENGSFSTVEGNSFGFVQLNTPYVFAGRFLPTERAIYGNGALLDTSVVSRSPLNADELCLGALYADNIDVYTGVGNGVVMMGAAWERALSDAEIAEVSRNPWQLFAPRSIWVPVSAGGATGYTLTADAGAYTLAGQDATLLKTRIVTADAGSYAVAGQDASVLVGHLITADAGAYTLAGQDATLTYTPAGAYTLTCDAGAYALAGQEAALLLARVMSADAGAYTLSGQDAALTYTPAALPTIGRPASDTSNSGWTASTGSDLYAMLDEVTPDAADYIVTTATGSICEMALQTTEYPGTAAQVLSYRASSSTGNSVIVRLKNTGGATVRSETQVLTSTDTLYEITLTSGEIAAITSGALSVELESA